MLFFQMKQSHIFTLCVIPPNWHDPGSWNPSSSKTRNYLFYIVNIDPYMLMVKTDRSKFLSYFFSYSSCTAYFNFGFASMICLWPVLVWGDPIQFRLAEYKYITNTRWWHDMDKLPSLLALCVGNPLVDFPHKELVPQAFDVFPTSLKWIV